MPPKTTNAQYKNRLGYDSGSKPAFLRALEAQISGKPDPTTRNRDGNDDEEWEQLDASRPAIPRRPDADEKARSDDEDFEDERPTVVVLKEGKHMSELEVTNEKRRGTLIQSERTPSFSCDGSLDVFSPSVVYRILSPLFV